MLTLLVGGARSGKSALAERLAERSGRPVVYVATAPRIPGDDDLDERIRRHRADRPQHWVTIEEELDLAAAIDAAGDALVVVDCLTVWVGNLLHHGRDDAEVLDASELALAAALRRVDAVVVSNEVGFGIVPGDELSRGYRDLLGRVNQQWTTAADRALLLVAGRALRLHDPDELLP